MGRVEKSWLNYDVSVRWSGKLQMSCRRQTIDQWPAANSLSLDKSINFCMTNTEHSVVAVFFSLGFFASTETWLTRRWAASVILILYMNNKYQFNSKIEKRLKFIWSETFFLQNIFYGIINYFIFVFDVFKSTYVCAQNVHTHKHADTRIGTEHILARRANDRNRLAF